MCTNYEYDNSCYNSTTQDDTPQDDYSCNNSSSCTGSSSSGSTSCNGSTCGGASSGGVTVPVTSIQVYLAQNSMKVGQWLYPSVNVNPVDATIKSVVWSSNKTSVASVNATKGYIHANSVGNAIITATALDGSGVKGSISVTVKAASNSSSGTTDTYCNNSTQKDNCSSCETDTETVLVSSIKLSPKNLAIEENGWYYTPSVTITPEDATNKSIAWSSDDTSVASINPSSGYIYGISQGTATITAMATDGSGITGTCTVTVIPASTESESCTDGSCSGSSSTCGSSTSGSCSGSSSTCGSSTEGSCNGSSSSDGSCSGSSSTGGSCSDSSCQEETCEPITIDPISVTLAYDTSAMCIGESRYVVAQISPPNATKKSVTWKSSNPNVATVDEGGYVTAKAIGTTTITATTVLGNKSGSCQISVKEKVHIIESFFDNNRNEYFFDIQFDSNGSVWKSVGYDLSRDNTWIPNRAKERYGYNTAQEYTEDQLAIIYRFDPLGLQHYMHYHFMYYQNSDADELFFKDRVFKKIFGEISNKYFYFTLSSDNQILYSPSGYAGCNREDVYSYAEVLFGFHTIIDWYDFFSDILTSFFLSIPGISTIAFGVELYQALFFSGSIKGIFSDSASEFLGSYADEHPNTFISFILSWPNKIFDICKTLATSLENAITIPNAYDFEIYHCMVDLGCVIEFESGNLKTSLQEVVDRLN